jgi:hypothetical protein
VRGCFTAKVFCLFTHVSFVFILFSPVRTPQPVAQFDDIQVNPNIWCLSLGLGKSLAGGPWNVDMMQREVNGSHRKAAADP